MFERFTRDEVSSWVWWPTTMVLLVLLVLTFPGLNRAIEQRRADAEARAWSISVGTLGPSLDGVDAAPVGGQDAGALRALVQDRVLGAPWTETVRIWAADSTLLWSSDPPDPVGSAAGLNDEQITRALADQTRAMGVIDERDLDGRPTDATYSAYAPFAFGGNIVAAQFEVSEATLLGDVRADWLGYRIVLGLATLLALALALGSMREPVARIGAGVPLSRASLPSGMELIGIEDKLELERAGANARERVAHMEDRLRESEQLRLRAEGELQKALTQLAIQPGRPARSVIPRPAEQHPSVPAATPAPPADGLSLVPSLDGGNDRRPPAPGEMRRPAAEVAPAIAPEPRTVPEPVGQVEPRIVPVPASEEPASEPVGPAVPERPIEAEPVPHRKPRRNAEQPSRRRHSAETPVVVVPEADAIVAGSADDDGAARQVLERLVEPVAASVAPADDPSLLRAKLARTAALKKPGSRHDERLRDDDPS